MSNQRIIWVKVWGVAAVQGAITLTWVIYNLYFPLLLIQLGIKKEFATIFLIVENALESIIEPVFGGLSDYHQRRFGSKIPIISTGIILSSTLFIVLPALVFFGNKNHPIWQLLLPFVAVVWAGAMAIFRSPAVALLGRCATTDRLPQAASILTLVGGIIGAFRFDSYGIILKLGEGFAFALGSVSLLIAGFVLRILNPPEFPQEVSRRQTRVSWITMSLIFVTGISVSWGLRFLMPTVNGVLTLQFGENNNKLPMMLFLIVLGLSALPAGKIATELGNSLAMQLGAIGTIVALSLFVSIPYITVKFIAIAFLIIAFSLILNGVIPFVLTLVPTTVSGLGVGMYFGGFSAGLSCFDFVVLPLGEIKINLGLIGAAVSFLLVLLWLIIGQSLYVRNSTMNNGQ